MLEIRRTAQVDGLNEAKVRTDAAVQQIGTIEALINKLEKEMLAWNP